MEQPSIKTRPWNWLDNGLLPILLILMRTAWLWPWLALLHAWFAPSQQSPVWPLAVLIGLPLLSSILTDRVLPSYRDPSATRRFGLIQMGIAALGIFLLFALLWANFYRAQFPLLSTAWIIALGYDLTDLQFELPVQVLALFSGIYLWLRGVLDARDPIHHEKVWGTFLAGVVSLGLYLWLSRFGVDQPPVDAGGWLILFFASGMAALAAANLNIASGWSPWRQSGGQIQANRYWLFSILATIGGLLALGMFLGWLIAPEEVAWLLNGVGVILGWVGQLLSWVLLGISFVLFWLIYPIYTFLQGLINREQVEPEPGEAEPPFQMPTPQALERLTDPSQTPEQYRWIGLAVLLVIIFVVFVLVLRRLRAAAENEPEEIHESIYSNDLLQDQLAAFWQGMLNRFGGGAPVGPAFADLTGETDTRRTIRAVYQRLLARAADSGHPRASAQTPLEYAPDLAETWPQPADAIQVITAGYVEARYAADPPSVETARAVTTAWDEIERAQTPKQG